MRFRKTTEADFKAIMQTLADGRDAIKELGIDQWQFGYPNEGIVKEDIEQGQSYVLEDEGTILGTVALVFTGEPTYDTIYDGSWLTSSTSDCPRYCAVHRIAVAKGAGRKGLGRRMLQEAESIATKEGAESLRIDTHEGNVRMHGLVRSLGYEECGIIHIELCGESTPVRIAYEKLLPAES